MTQELMGDIGIPQQENEMYKAVSDQYKNEKGNISFKTELSEQDIMNFSRMQVLFDWTDKKLKILPLFMEHIMKLRVSKERKGRFEFFDAIKPSPMVGMPQDQQQQGGASRLFQSWRN